MELLKRIDRKLMSWFNTYPSWYKYDHKEHGKSLAFAAIAASSFTIDIVLNGWGFPNTLGVTILWPTLFYGGRMWYRLRVSEEMGARKQG